MGQGGREGVASNVEPSGGLFVIRFAVAMGTIIFYLLWGHRANGGAPSKRPDFLFSRFFFHFFLHRLNAFSGEKYWSSEAFKCLANSREKLSPAILISPPLLCGKEIHQKIL